MDWCVYNKSYYLNSKSIHTHKISVLALRWFSKDIQWMGNQKRAKRGITVNFNGNLENRLTRLVMKLPIIDQLKLFDQCINCK